MSHGPVLGPEPDFKIQSINQARLSLMAFDCLMQGFTERQNVLYQIWYTMIERRSLVLYVIDKMSNGEEFDDDIIKHAQCKRFHDLKVILT